MTNIQDSTRKVVGPSWWRPGIDRTWNAVAKTSLSHATLVGIGLFFVLPFYWLASTALKSDQQIFQIPPVWIPKPAVWSNFPKALAYIPFARYTFNTDRKSVV